MCRSQNEIVHPAVDLYDVDICPIEHVAPWFVTTAAFENLPGSLRLVFTMFEVVGFPSLSWHNRAVMQYKAQYQSALVDVERQGMWSLKIRPLLWCL